MALMTLMVDLSCGCRYTLKLESINEIEVLDGSVRPGPEAGGLMGCHEHGPQVVLDVDSRVWRGESNYSNDDAGGGWGADRDIG